MDGDSPAVQYLEQQIDKGFLECGVPEHIQSGICDYVLNGFQPGHFLTAAFSDQLVRSFGLADGVNTAAMKEIAAFLYGYVPMECRGSAEKVQAWCDSGGARGKFNKAVNP